MKVIRELHLSSFIHSTMTRAIRFSIFAFALLFTFALEAKPKREKLALRIVHGEYALEEIMARSDTAIPATVLQDAKGIILTVSYRGSFLVGGHGGNGVLIAKNPITGQWTVPAFMKTGGANFGLQAGVKELDTIYVIMDDSTLRKAYTGRFDLGADASAVAGPAGVVSEASGSDYNKANILVYTTAKGLYAGVAVKAGWISPDNKSTKFFYQTDYSTPEIILSDWFEMPREANPLVARLNYYMNGGR